MQNKERTFVTQPQLPGFEAGAQKWEIIELTRPNGHKRLMARKIG